MYGRPFTAQEVEALGIPNPEPVLSSLARRELLATHQRARAQHPEKGRGREREYAFRSSLVSDVAYRLLSSDLRADLHRRAADVIEKRRSVDLEEVARHRDEGGQRAEAGRRYAEAAIVAGKRGDSATVLRCAQNAIDLGVPEALRFDLHMARADALRYLGRTREWGEALEQARGCARTPIEQARVQPEQAAMLLRVGATKEGLEVALSGREAALASGDGEAITGACCRLAGSYAFLHRFEEARAALDEARRALPPESERMAAHIEAVSGDLASVLGDVGKARDAFARAAAINQRLGDARRALTNQLHLADTYNRLGAYAEAEAALRETLGSARRVANQGLEPWACLNLGYACVMQGRPDEAFEWIDRSVKLGRRTRDVRATCCAHLYRANALLVARDAVAAVAEAQKARAESARIGWPSMQKSSATVLARALFALGRLDEADEASADAMPADDASGAQQEDEAEAFLVRAEILEASGRAAEAEQVRERGRTRVRELAARIEDPEWRRRFLTDVAAHRALLGA